MEKLPQSNPDNSLESVAEKPLFKLVLVRHEHTDYQGSDPALTPQGFADAEELGKLLVEEKLLDKDKSAFLLHSPQRRSQETLEGIVKGAEIKTENEMRTIGQLRTADKGPNYQEFVDAGMQVVNEEGSLSPKAWDRITANQYGDDPLYNSRPDVVETKDSRSARLYRSLEYLTRWIDKKEMAHGQQVIAVSHFEIIMHIIDDVFDIETFPTHNLPDFGDFVSIESFKTDSANMVRLKIKFRDREKEMLFDRENRLLKEIETV